MNLLGSACLERIVKYEKYCVLDVKNRMFFLLILHNTSFLNVFFLFLVTVRKKYNKLKIHIKDYRLEVNAVSLNKCLSVDSFPPCPPILSFYFLHNFCSSSIFDIRLRRAVSQLILTKREREHIYKICLCTPPNAYLHCSYTHFFFFAQ